MDEGPERARLRLRPNHAFYDTYEVLAPGQSAPNFLTHHGYVQEAPPSPATTAVAVKVDGSSLGKEGNTAMAAATAVIPATSGPRRAPGSRGQEQVGPNETIVGVSPSVSFAEEGLGVVPPSQTRRDVDETAGLQGAAAAAAAAAAASEALRSHEQGGAGMADGTVQVTSVASVVAAGAKAGGGMSVRDGSVDGNAMPVTPATNAPGGVAEITALVKSMSETVGLARSKARAKPITGVFDLDDTDTSALLELEELHFEDVPEESVRRRVALGSRGRTPAEANRFGAPVLICLHCVRVDWLGGLMPRRA